MPTLAGLQYRAPDGTPSSIDAAAGNTQMESFSWLRKAIITARKDRYFAPLSSNMNQPKNFGKSVKIHEYYPLLDDRNLNTEGIDASGVAMTGATGANPGYGNLYGSSRDIGVITGKLPVLGENGGRVNRVSFSRVVREGSLNKYGFFFDFTKETLDFDSDPQLMDHLSRELMNGAVQIDEALIQKDLLTQAGVVLFAGVAQDDDEVTGEGASPSVVSYANLMRLDQILTDNRTPKSITLIEGSKNVDTRVIPAARAMYVGSALMPVLKAMKDLFNNKAFVEVQHYAAAGTAMPGEQGAIDAFRIIQVPEMLHWGGMGADVGTNPGYRETNGRYDIYPMLVVGEDSFVTISFMSDGKTGKFNVITKMPGAETASRENDPYGQNGFSSIMWYYGMLVKRSERIAVVKTVAPI